MSVFANNAIRDFLKTKGVNAAIAANLQTYILEVETAGLITATDKAMVTVLEKIIRPLIDVAVATYGLSYNAANTAIYIRTYMPQYAGSATLYGAIVANDINTNLVGAPVAEGYYSAVQKYQSQIAGVLTEAAKAVRHFVTEIGMAEFVGQISPADVLY